MNKMYFGAFRGRNIYIRIIRFGWRRDACASQRTLATIQSSYTIVKLKKNRKITEDKSNIIEKTELQKCKRLPMAHENCGKDILSVARCAFVCHWQSTLSINMESSALRTFIRTYGHEYVALAQPKGCV